MKKTASNRETTTKTSKPGVEEKDLKPGKNPKGGSKIAETIHHKRQTATKTAAATMAVIRG